LALLAGNVLAKDSSPGPGPETGLITDINMLTYTIANEHDHFYSFIGVRALSMVHLAIHDILSAAYGQYEPYYWTGTADEANVPAATIEVTRSLLLEAYPKRKDTINLVCNSWLSNLKQGPYIKNGKLLGQSVARAYLVLRNSDGHEKDGEYTPMTKPGGYRYTPGNGEWVLRPDFTVAHPFGLDSVTQFRSPIPPALNSSEYTASFREVKAFGSGGSAVRSPDQTRYAHWWAEFGEHSWNRIGRITAKARSLPAIRANRMFALFNMTLYDLYLASLESKYHYDTWRPYTAIRQAGTDGNPATVPDANWTPEIQTPPWPEYPSAHAAVGSAGAEILSAVYGTPEVHFEMESVTALPDGLVLAYDNLDDAARDCADSRIMNGFHFRFATEEGKRQGRVIAKHTLNNYLRQLPRP
jgi:hypothetical protein